MGGLTGELELSGDLLAEPWGHWSLRPALHFLLACAPMTLSDSDSASFS